MSKIVFPSLNLEFNISKIAFKIGSADVYWYAVLIVSGIVLSLFLMGFTKKKYGIKYEDFLEIFIYVLIGGLLGARLFYVLFNLEYYLQNLNQISLTHACTHTHTHTHTHSFCLSASLY